MKQDQTIEVTDLPVTSNYQLLVDISWRLKNLNLFSKNPINNQ